MRIVLTTAPEFYMTVEYTPPLGLCYIASVLMNDGHEVKIIDAHAGKKRVTRLGVCTKEVADIVKEIRDFKPDFVGLKCL